MSRKRERMNKGKEKELLKMMSERRIVMALSNRLSRRPKLRTKALVELPMLLSTSGKKKRSEVF